MIYVFIWRSWVKKLGNIVNGEGSFLQGIEKDSIKGVEGVTILLFPGGYSNEGNRAGFFINSEEIKWNQIPQKPGNLIGEVIVETDTTNTNTQRQEDVEKSGTIMSDLRESITEKAAMSPEEFKDSNPWFLPDVTIKDNPKYHPDDIFSSR